MSSSRLPKIDTGWNSKTRCHLEEVKGHHNLPLKKKKAVANHNIANVLGSTN